MSGWRKRQILEELMKSRHPAIRELLLASKDGLTVKEIAKHFACNPATIYNCMNLICGVYIDRWAGPNRGQYSAVYVCVETPENAPHPTENDLPASVWRHDGTGRSV
jgi:hypothetical protein